MPCAGITLAKRFCCPVIQKLFNNMFNIRYCGKPNYIRFWKFLRRVVCVCCTLDNPWTVKIPGISVKVVENCLSDASSFRGAKHNTQRRFWSGYGFQKALKCRNLLNLAKLAIRMDCETVLIHKKHVVYLEHGVSISCCFCPLALVVPMKTKSL